MYSQKLTEPRRKKRRRDVTLKQPLPIPISSISGHEASNATWRWYEGTLSGDSVIVSEPDSMKMISSMGFFGEIRKKDADAEKFVSVESFEPYNRIERNTSDDEEDLVEPEQVDDLNATSSSESEIEDDENKSQTNGLEIHQNEADIKDNEDSTHNTESEIRLNESEIHQNEADIHQNEADIHQNEADIKDNEDSTHNTKSEIRRDESEIQQDGSKIHQDESEIHQDESDKNQDEDHSNKTEIRRDEFEIQQDESKIYQDESEILQKESEIHQDESDKNQDEDTSNKTKIRPNETEVHLSKNELAETNTESKNDKSQIPDSRLTTTSLSVSNCNVKKAWGSWKEKETAKDILLLDNYEAFFLAYGLGCLLVKDGDKMLTIDNLWEHFSQSDSTFQRRYVVFHHFRAKNWVVRDGTKFGNDFLLYRDGPPFYHASYSVRIESGICITWTELAGLNRVTESAAKELIIVEVVEKCSKNKDKDRKISPKDYIENAVVKEVFVKRWVPSQKREKD